MSAFSEPHCSACTHHIGPCFQPHLTPPSVSGGPSSFRVYRVKELTLLWNSLCSPSDGNILHSFFTVQLIPGFHSCLSFRHILSSSLLYSGGLIHILLFFLSGVFQESGDEHEWPSHCFPQKEPCIICISVYNRVHKRFILMSLKNIFIALLFLRKSVSSIDKLECSS